LLSHSLGDNATQQGDLERARTYLDAALAYYRGNGMLPYLPGILTSMATLDDRANRPESAVHRRLEAQQITAELLSRRALATLEAQPA
jgi:hypothetical protein